MRSYDFVMTHRLDADDFFIHTIQQECASRRLNFFLIEPLWVEPFFEYYEKGEAWAKVLLNMHSEHHQPEEIFHRLVRLAEERRTFVIDPLSVALEAFDKARLHGRLAAAGFRTPETVIVPREEAERFVLAPEQARLLGRPFVIKPAMGYGKRGVILDAQSEKDLLRSIGQWPDRAYLLQRRVAPRDLGERPAYFRVFHAFGNVWPCWWNCYTDRYAPLRPEEEERWVLGRLRTLALELARLTGMNFFSTEIAQTAEEEFILIDYINDQCHMLTQSSQPAIGAPDELVAAVARALVDGAERIIRRDKNA